MKRLRLPGARLLRDDMARDSIVMVASTSLAGIFNYLYQLSMGRMLSREQYGVFFSLTSIFAVISVVAGATRTSVAKFTSKYKADGEVDRIGSLWSSSLRRALLLGFLSFALAALLAPLLSRFLREDNNWYAIILFSSMLLVFAVPVNWGVLQGVQRFVPLGTTITLLDLLKLVAAALMVTLGFGLGGGLLAVFVAEAMVFLVTFYLLRGFLHTDCRSSHFEGFFSYSGWTLAATFSYAVCTNIDVILARRFFGEAVAGDYSALSVLGRVVLYVPIGVSMAMFPKVSELVESGGRHRFLLHKALLYTLLLSGCVVAVYGLFGHTVTSVLFGERYDIETASLLKYGLAMLLFAVSGVLMNYLFSLNRARMAACLWLMIMALQMVLMGLFHGNVDAMINVMTVAGVAGCVTMLVSGLAKDREAA